MLFPVVVSDGSAFVFILLGSHYVSLFFMVICLLVLIFSKRCSDKSYALSTLVGLILAITILVALYDFNIVQPFDD